MILEKLISKKMQSFKLIDECFAIIGSVEGIVPKFCFYCSIIIFWMAMGCGVARFVPPRRCSWSLVLVT